MNFFGHAVVARQVDDDPAFLLGAMAPDLLAMCGAVAGAATSPQVSAGQAHHLRVDARFHAAPAFTALVAWAARTLVERGLPRGPARGAAHVGVELFLDGLLARDTEARAAYLHCLVEAEATRAPFVWGDALSERRWRQLVPRLREGTVPDAYRDPDFVAARLVGALGRRPRLALTAGGAEVLRAFLPALERRVAEALQALSGALLWPATS
jgi:acyl carrier protein phosphodiesterase